MGSAASALGRAAALAIGIGCASIAARPASAASSRDYPGPCTGEVNAAGVPLYLSSDYRGQNPVYGVVVLGDTGRFKLGISCVATGFVVARVGPDSALCTVRGLCTPSELLGLSEADIEAVRFIPNQVPFFHICQKHGFGWYDATNVPAGIYVAAAKSDSAVWGLVEGHGTMDTYAFTGNGGAFQQVNCPRPPTPVCGNFVLEAGETCDDGNRVDGDCCSATCQAASAGSACPGNGDLCAPGSCDGAGHCLAATACIDEPIDGAKLLLQRKNGKEKLLWRAKNRVATATGATYDPTASGASLELFSPNAAPVSIALPAGGWTARGADAFKYRDRQAAPGAGSIKVATVVRGRSIKVVGRWAGFALTDPLTGVGLRLVGGTLATCSLFPASTVVSDAPGVFAARGPTPVLMRCDRETLGLGVPTGGGDLNPGLPPDDPGDPGGGFCPGDTICPILPILE